ncbi:MAG: prefoldin subunit [Desulfurococcales archaeon]|nr:prefoldin subunit [Desulfurococcales archaeon]
MSAESVEILRRELEELEDAIKILEKLPDNRAVYMRFGRLMIEVSRDEAVEYALKRIAAIRSLMEKK